MTDADILKLGDLTITLPSANAGDWPPVTCPSNSQTISVYAEGVLIATLHNEGAVFVQEYDEALETTRWVRRPIGSANA